MKYKRLACLTGVLLAAVIFAGCEWEEAGDFNTSRGGGSLINFSGVYRAKDNGTYLFGSNITHIIINQIGNTIEVRDSNNSYYQGSIGTPGVVASPNYETGEYLAGAVMLQAQINFSGENIETEETINFIGLLHAVAVEDIRGTTLDQSTTLDIQDGEFSSTTTRTSTETYTLTEANTQYILEGNWVEGEEVNFINAIAPGVGGTLTTP